MDNGLSIPYNGQKMYHKEESTGTAYKISTIGKVTEIIENNCI
jgi:hypothetical protein